VLADSLGSSTVNLRVYFWLNGTEHSWLKVRSSVIRLVKRTFQDAGISMPDEAREIVFPRGVPIATVDGKLLPPRPDGDLHPTERQAAPRAPLEPISTDAEAGLSTEAGEIEDQARRARSPEAGENLLTTQ
jgi:hypothetical protein